MLFQIGLKKAKRIFLMCLIIKLYLLKENKFKTSFFLFFSNFTSQTNITILSENDFILAEIEALPLNWLSACRCVWGGVGVGVGVGLDVSVSLSMCLPCPPDPQS